MKRETIGVIKESYDPDDDDGGPGIKYLLPSGFQDWVIEVWESPWELEVKHIGKEKK